MPSRGNILKDADAWVEGRSPSAGWRAISRIYFYFSSVPDVVKPENYWFYNITNLAYILISLLHICWIITFSAFGFTPMSVIQLVSVSSYIVSIGLNRKGLHLGAMIIALLEVNLHQIFAAYYLGWGTGFQNFIPLVGLMPFLKYNERWSTKILLALMSMSFYLWIDVNLKNHIPALPINYLQISILTISNAIIGFILVTLWGIVLSYSYNRTVADLLKKEQELFATQKAAEQADILRALEITERDIEIFQLRNVELKNSNDEILYQKKQIEKLVSEQEVVIALRTRELETANRKLIELIQYNAHNLREPVTRIMGAMNIAEYMTHDEFFEEIWDPMGQAVDDLDTRIRNVITLANDTVEQYEQQHGKVRPLVKPT